MERFWIIWTTIGIAGVTIFTVVDLRNSIRNHNASLGFAIYHWCSRLPLAVFFFGFLWPIGAVMTVWALFETARHKRD